MGYTFKRSRKTKDNKSKSKVIPPPEEEKLSAQNIEAAPTDNELPLLSREEIIEIIEILPESGYRPVTNILKRSQVINHKKVYRIMRANDLLCRKNKRFKAETTDSRHKQKKYLE